MSYAYLMHTAQDSKYTAKQNKHSQTVIVLAADADFPIVEARWYAGGTWSSGVTGVRPGETPESAAKRAYWRLVPACYESTFTATIIELH